MMGSTHPIIEITELTQLVAQHLLLDSPESLVLLACTCRALEEQALSTLWSKQASLVVLIISTLPSDILTSPPPVPQVCDDDFCPAHFSWAFPAYKGRMG